MQKLFFTMLTRLPMLIAVLYNIIKRIFQGYMVYSVLYSLEAIHIFYYLSCNAIIVELIRHEIDTVKQLLISLILQCSDESLRYELRAALEYIALRPFKYSICRVVHLDIELLLSIISITISYVVVITQLTHFLYI